MDLDHDAFEIEFLSGIPETVSSLLKVIPLCKKCYSLFEANWVAKNVLGLCATYSQLRLLTAVLGIHLVHHVSQGLVFN